MRTYKILNILFVLLINIHLGCRQKYYPGYDFDLFKNTPAYKLAKAVEDDDTSAIRKCIVEDKIPVNYQEQKFGKSLLSLAIINNKIDAARELLKLSANPNLRSKINDSSPFLDACFYATDLKNSIESFQLLISYGADVNSVQLDTSLDQFGKKKNWETTALRILVNYGDIESVKFLVKNGASLENYPKNEGSIVTSALLGDNLDMVKYFLIDKRVPIPDYCVIRQPGTVYEEKLSIVDLLNEETYSDNQDKRRLKDEILAFLKDNKDLR